MRVRCWSRQPGRRYAGAFYQRIARRRANHIAAVAVARKLAVIIWHLLKHGEDYAWVRPALHAKKLRDLELRSGQPARRGQRGMAYDYNLNRIRLEERRRPEQAETAYKRQTEALRRRSAALRTSCLRARSTALYRLSTS